MRSVSPNTGRFAPKTNRFTTMNIDINLISTGITEAFKADKNSKKINLGMSRGHPPPSECGGFSLFLDPHSDPNPI